MTVRGCAYAGSKGVVWGPVKDVVHISHGPVGCGRTRTGHPAQLLQRHDRRRRVRRHALDERLPRARHRLRRGQEARHDRATRLKALFPLASGISVQSECPVGLIGDDIESVAEAEDRVARQAGRPGALRGLPRSRRSRWATTSPTTPSATTSSTRPRPRSRPPPTTSRSSATTTSAGMRGRSRRSSRRWGCASSHSGPVTRTLTELANATEGQAQPHPLLPLDELHLPPRWRSAYGIPWVEYNFFGPTKIYESIRGIAVAVRRDASRPSRGAHRTL